MKTKDAMRKAWKIYRSAPESTLTYLLIVLIAAILPLVPLLCLAQASIRWFALLGIVLFVLVSLPVRMNAAAVLQNAVKTGTLRNSGLVDFSNYGTKLINGLKNTALLLLWGAPGIAATVYMYQVYTGSSDVVTVAMTLNKFGGGDIMTGLIYVLLIYLACWLPLVFGFCFHSGTRHAMTLSGTGMLKGNRGGVMKTWVCSLVTVIPFIVVLGVGVYLYVPGLMTALKRLNMDAMKPLAKSLLIWAGASVVVTLLPLIPLRHLMVAAHVGGLMPEADMVSEENQVK